MINQKRIGKIEVSEDFINRNFEEFKTILREITILRVEENIIMFGKLTYYGVSDHFRELEENEMVPLYHAIITKKEDGSISVKFDEVGYGRD